MIVKKLWGHEDILVNDLYCLKRMYVKNGFECSIHMHRKKTETFLIAEGLLCLTLYNIGIDIMDHVIVFSDIYKLSQGEHFTILSGQYHSFHSVSKECYFIECSTKHDDNDVERLKQSRKI